MTTTDWQDIACKLLVIAEYFFHSTIDSTVYDEALDEEYVTYMDKVRLILNGTLTD